jgi:hypothetical protein
MITIINAILTNVVFTYSLSDSSFAGFYQPVSLIDINNTTVNIPARVIVPINIEIQNAQIYANMSTNRAQP